MGDTAANKDGATDAEAEVKTTDAGEGADKTGTADQNKNQDGDGKGSDDTGKKDESTDQDEDDKDEPDDNEEPPIVKRSKESYIQQRKAVKAAKDAKNKDDQGDDEDDMDDDDDSDDDQDITTKVQKEVSKILSPILKDEEAKAIKSDVTDFLSKNPDFKKFEAKILRFASHESRKHLPISAIAYEVAGPKLMQIGAKRAAEADKKAKSSEAGGGGSTSKTGATKGVLEMSIEEFKAHQQEVLRKR